MENFKVEFFDKNDKPLPQFNRKVEGQSHWDVCVHTLLYLLPALRGAEDFNVIEL